MQQPLNILSDHLPDEAVTEMDEGASNIAKYCDELDLVVSGEMARKGLKGITSYNTLRLSMNMLMNTLFIELNNRKFYEQSRFN